ncbi:hypothetical protein NBRC116592_13050 [Colwellia sp. KU-HH00111]|uniref:hypothetical protein n=1 Tax=Colwellia sp. KU-HH00111 TaxID=3127652 RepID=UPI0031072F16
MEIIPVLKQLSEIGLSAPVIISVYALIRLNHLIANFDKRLSIIETIMDSRKKSRD